MNEEDKRFMLVVLAAILIWLLIFVLWVFVQDVGAWPSPPVGTPVHVVDPAYLPFILGGAR